MIEKWRDWMPYFEAVAEEVDRRVDRLLEQFAASLKDWLEDVLNHPIPDDWPAELERFVQHSQYYGITIRPHSIRDIGQLIEARQNGTGPFAGAPASAGESAPSNRRPLLLALTTEASAPPTPPETDGPSADERNHLLQFARRAAYLEQQRIALSDDEWARYEYYLYQNFLRHRRGEPPLEHPQFWHDKNDAFNQRRRGTGQPAQTLLSAPTAAGAMATRDDSAGRAQFFDEKLAAAQACLDEIKRTLEALGHKLDAAKVDENVEVDADVDTVEDLIWRYNDAIESAMAAWLRENLSGDVLRRLYEMRTPWSFGLPGFLDDEQTDRVRKLGLRISERLGRRDAAMDRLVFAMRTAEVAGTVAGVAIGGGVVWTAFQTGGKWAVIKTVAVMGAAALAEQGAEAGLRAAGANEQTIRGVRLAAVVVSFIILRRRGTTAAGEAKAPSPPQSAPTPAALPKGRLLSPAAARRKVGIAFNKARAKEYPHNEVPVEKTGRGKPYILDSYDDVKGEIVFRRHTQFSEIQFKTAQAYFREFIKKYPPGSVVADVPSAKGLAGEKLEGKMIFEVPPQWKAIPKAVLDAATRLNIWIRDTNGRIYNPH